MCWEGELGVWGRCDSVLGRSLGYIAVWSHCLHSSCRRQVCCSCYRGDRTLRHINFLMLQLSQGLTLLWRWLRLERLVQTTYLVTAPEGARGTCRDPCPILAQHGTVTGPRFGRAEGKPSCLHLLCLHFQNLLLHSQSSSLHGSSSFSSSRLVLAPSQQFVVKHVNIT